MFKDVSLIFVAAVLVFTLVGADASNREDPLRPPGYKFAGKTKADKKEVQTWFVNEILHSEGRRVAIINNTTVKQGDTIDGAKVLEITANKVTLEYKNRIINSRLGLVPVKRLKTNDTGR